MKYIYLPVCVAQFQMSWGDWVVFGIRSFPKCGFLGSSEVVYFRGEMFVGLCRSFLCPVLTVVTSLLCDVTKASLFQKGTVSAVQNCILKAHSMCMCVCVCVIASWLIHLVKWDQFCYWAPVDADISFHNTLSMNLAICIMWRVCLGWDFTLEVQMS